MTSSASKYRTETRRPSREFRITIGLREGYEPDRPEHSVEEVTELFRRWIETRQHAGEPFVTGIVTEGVVIYGLTHHEATDETVAVLSGEVPAYLELPDPDVESLLDTLADELGTAFNQEQMYLTYRETSWIRTRA